MMHRMTRQRGICSACALLLAGSALFATTVRSIELPPTASISALRDEALAQYDLGHYADAIRSFERAAALNDARSAEVLALMFRFGERLYGDHVRADSEAARRWVEVAVAARAAAVGNLRVERSAQLHSPSAP